MKFSAPGIPIIVGTGLLTLLLTRHWLETSMALHMAVQIPLLVLLGTQLARLLQQYDLPSRQWRKRYRSSLLLLALFILGYWMLPLNLDAALHQPRFELLKWFSLPLAGLALVLSWAQLPVVLRGILHLEALATLLRLGWLYLVAPRRYCVSYGLDAQQQLGSVLLIYGALYAAFLAIRVMVGRPHQATQTDSEEVNA